MFEVSIYDDSRPHRYVTAATFLGAERLNPEVARKALEKLNLPGGLVFQDGVMLEDERYGTVAYRVYRSGRVKRMFWEYEDIGTLPAPF